MLECAVNNLQQTFLNEFLIWILFGTFAFVGTMTGLFLEDRFDFIGNKAKRRMALNRNFMIALDCVMEAEKELIGPNRGKERFSWAVERYAVLANERDPNKVFDMVTRAFNASTLYH